MDEHKQLMAALAEAQIAVNGVEKNARNEYAGYDYVSADGMVRQLRVALLDAGLAFFRAGWHIDGDKVVSEFALVHPKSGAHKIIKAEMPVFEAKGRPLDKAVLGALTTSLSYVLRDLLLVPRVDELEIDNRVSDEPAPRILRKAAASAPATNTAQTLVEQVESIALNKPEGPDAYIQAITKRASDLHRRSITSLSEMPEELLTKIVEAHKGA